MTVASKGLVRVALVGRRNVGKSTLLNALYGRRRAITDPIPGLTRDILEVEIVRGPYRFLLSDTPGLDIDDPGALDRSILERARAHIASVDLILFLFEAPAPASFDYEFLDLVRRDPAGKPVVFVVNKVDGPARVADALAEFYSMGIPDPVPISARGRFNLDLLLRRLATENPRIKRVWTEADEAAEKQKRKKKTRRELRELEAAKNAEQALVDANADAARAGRASDESDAEGEYDPDEEAIVYEFEEDGEAREVSQPRARRAEKNIQAAPDRRSAVDAERDDSTVFPERKPGETRIAIVGRPNAGKSSIFNRLAGEDLSLVSDIPGTTRDTVDTLIRVKGRTVRIVDTAGMRRPAKLLAQNARVDFFSVTRAKRAIRDARVVVHVIDAVAGITDFDKKISALIEEYRRPVVLALNKWDAAPNKDHKTLDEFRDRLEFLFPHARHMPIVFCSALTGQRLPKLLDECIDLDERMKFRAPTRELNDRVQRWFRNAPGAAAGLKILYATQPESEPPVIVLFVNRKKDFRANITAYIENKLRKEYRLDGIPLRVYIRESGEAKRA